MRHFTPFGKTLCTLLICVVLQVASYGQTYINEEWQNLAGIPDAISHSASVTDNQGNVIVTSNTVVSGQDADIITTKYTSDGGLDWQLYYNGASNGKDYSSAITVDGSGNIYVTGATYNAANDYDYVTIKYSASGVQQWAAIYNGPANSIDIPLGITTDDSGYVYVIGSSQGVGTLADYLTVKYDGNGVEKWAARYNYSGWDDVPVGIVASGNTLYVTGGSSSSSGSVAIATVVYNAVNGTTIAARRDSLAATGIETPTAIKRDANGDIYVTGMYYDPGVNNEVIRTVKMDFYLNILWSASYTGNGFGDGAKALEVDDAGNVYVGGFVGANGQRDYLLLKYDDNGNELWQSFPNFYDAGEESLVELALNADGELYAIGQFYPQGSAVATVFKFDAESGEVMWFAEESASAPEGISLDDFGNIYVVGKIWNGTTIQNSTVKFAAFTDTYGILRDSLGNGICKENQALIRFEPSSLIANAMNDKRLVWGKASTFVQPAMLTTMASKLGLSLSDMSNAKMIKVYPSINQADSLIVDRNGETVRLPDFWTSLLLIIPSEQPLSLAELSNAVDSLNAIHPGIRYTDPNAIVRALTNDKFWADSTTDIPKQYNLYDVSPGGPYSNAHINVLPAWNKGIKGKNTIRVGVLDYPVLWRHKDLSTNGTVAGSVVKGGYDYTSGTAVPILSNANPVTDNGTTSANDGHGTAVAGIIGALSNNGRGIAGIAGGDAGQGIQGVQLFSQGILKSPQPNQGPIPDSVAIPAVLNAIMDCYDGTFNNKPLDILNNSWGVNTGSSFFATNNFRQLRDQFRMAHKMGCIVTAARGNYGNGGGGSLAAPFGDQLVYPATFRDDWVISVGASGFDGKLKYVNTLNPGGNNDNNVQSLTVQGVSSWGREMDCLAPGASRIVPSLWHTNDSSYRRFANSSCAAPHVAGLAALLLQYSTRTKLAPEDVEHLIEYGCDDIAVDNQSIWVNSPTPAVPAAATGYDARTGWGKINIGNSIALIDSPKVVVHFEANPTSPKDTTLSDIYKLSHDFIAANNTTYSGIQYMWKMRYTATVHHNLSPGAFIVPLPSNKPAAWVRNSASNLWGDFDSSGYDASSGSYVKYLTPEVGVKLDAFNKDSATITGYNYWLLTPVFAFAINTAPKVRMAYSMLVSDPLYTGITPIEKGGASTLAVVPNPAHTTASIYFNATTSQPYRLVLMDAQGKIVMAREGHATSGYNGVTLDLQSLSSGLYIAHLAFKGAAPQFAKIVKH